MRFFRDSRGRAPFFEWLDSLDPPVASAIAEKIEVLAQVGMASIKNNVKALGGGLYEIKWGSVRVFFIQQDDELIVIDGLVKQGKAGQARAIKRVRQWLKEFE